MGKHDALIECYASGGALVAYATAGLSEARTKATPGPGAWSIAQLVGHLLDSDLVFADRMKRLIAEENPTLQSFDEQLWVERLNSAETPVEEAVIFLAANHQWMTRILRRLSEQDFDRTGTHTIRGAVSLAQVLSMASGHIDHHLKFLYAKRDNLGVGIEPRFTNRAGVYP